MEDLQIKTAQSLSLKGNSYLLDPSIPYLYQRRAILLMLKRPKMILGDDCGLGKGEPVDERVMTPFGWRRIGDLKEGDPVTGSSGAPTRVTHIYRRGVLPIFRVSFSDGTSVRVDGDHLWLVGTTNYVQRGQPFVVKSTRELQGDLSYSRRQPPSKWRIPMVGPVLFTGRGRTDLIDPYLLGVWLGDGTQNTFGAHDSSSVPEQVGKILPRGWSMRKCELKDRTPVFRIIPHFGSYLKQLGLWDKVSWNKFIPDSYLFASPEDRVSLLQGLLDTDGEIRPDHASLSTASEVMADQVIFLVQSLGGVARKSSRIPKIGDVEYRRSYKVSIVLPEGIEGTRAKVWPNRRKYPPVRVMRSIVPEGEEDVVCITVEAEDQLYVTEGFIVTHNTLVAIVSYTYLKTARPETKALVLTEKSALRQWMREFAWLAPSIKTKIITAETFPDKNQRISAMRQNSADVVITTYSMIYKYWQYLMEGMQPRFILYADEPNYFKNCSSLLHRKMFEFSGYPARSYGLTATVIENKLEEAFGIFRIICPGTLSSLSEFHRDYCVRKRIKRGVVVTIGYRNLDKFRAKIDPAFYGRLQDDPEVMQALPEAITKDVEVLLSKEQSTKVVEAMDRIIQMPGGEIKQVEVLPSLILAQQLVNDPGLLGFDIPSGKMEALVETLSNSLEGERVIVYSKFRSQIDRIERALKKVKIECVRITGAEKLETRYTAQERFMSDGLDRVNVLLMTRAGLKALNLQKGGHIFFFDLPWSYGHYRQGIGRIKRTGSIHKKVGVYRMVGVLHPDVASFAGGEETIDHYTLKVLNKKKELFNILTGDVTDLDSALSEVTEIYQEIRASRKK